MKILLSGASGFYGCHAVDALLKDGHDLFAYRRSHTSVQRLGGNAQHVRWFDLEGGGLEAPFKAAGKLDAVVHCATLYGRSEETSSAVLRVNTLFGLELLEAAVSSKCPLFLNLDTFFHKPSSAVNYATKYSISKRHFVEWARFVSTESEISVANMKLEHMYGPNDHGAKFAVAVAHACLGNVPELELTGGIQVRDFVFVQDVVSAMLCILGAENRRGFYSYEVGTGVGYTIREFVEEIHRVSDSKTELKFGALPYRDGEIMHSVADLKMLGGLGWSPRYTMRQGVRLMVESLKNKNSFTAPPLVHS